MQRNPECVRDHELSLQRAVTAWIVTGLLFMLLPGTFLGAWNLITISGQHSAKHIDPAWLQAHGHAQIFGWIGSFILGIGFYSLSKTAGLARAAAYRSWLSWGFWTVGMLLRWSTNIWQWNWRWMLPLSAVLELVAFAIFFMTVSRHRSNPAPASEPPSSRVWMGLVIAGSIGFLLSLGANVLATAEAAVYGSNPAIPDIENRRLLALFTWAFPVVTIWGFSARWLPVFLGLREARGGMLILALAINIGAVAAALLGWWLPASVLFAAATAVVTLALGVLGPSIRKPETLGVHQSFPVFVRLAYGWLAVSAALSIAAVLWDAKGGLWGASRHALTVGFISTMVFAIGQRILPAFCGMRVLFSPVLMLLGLLLLQIGCGLRVISEICAYEGYVPFLWPLLTVSAIIEMAAVSVFAVNLLLTFRGPQAHLKRRHESLIIEKLL
jgi:hypothetical protein